MWSPFNTKPVLKFPKPKFASRDVGMNFWTQKQKFDQNFAKSRLML